MDQKLDEIVGKDFKYKGKNIKIKSWKKVTATYVIFTSGQTFNLYENEVDIFLSELKNVPIQVKNKELKPNKMAETENNIVSIQEENLSTILLNTIQKIQTDKSYIGQANAICNVVTQMINIKKLELQLKKK